MGGRPLFPQSKELFYAASVPNRFPCSAAPLPAGAAGGFSADHPGAGRLFCAGLGYGIYVAVLGAAGVDAHAHGTVVYGGSLEFVLASLLLGAFSPLSAFLMALMIQARHLFYGLAMLERYKGYGWRSFT